MDENEEEENERDLDMRNDQLIIVAWMLLREELDRHIWMLPPSETTSSSSLERTLDIVGTFLEFEGHFLDFYKVYFNHIGWD